MRNEVMKASRNMRMGLGLIVIFIAGACPNCLAAPNYTVQDIGALKGGNALGRSIDNVSGNIVGSSGVTHGSNTHAFLWSHQRGVKDLGVLPGGDYSEAFGSNDSGDVVGDSNTARTLRAVLWDSHGRMSQLVPLA